jgi:glycine dehydrogenase subunit 2
VTGSEPLIFEISAPGKTASFFPPRRWEEECLRETGGVLRRTRPIGLPEASEPEVVRHYTRLSQKNFSVDTHFYPLGSCTMKYNPRMNEDLSALPGFAGAHPMESEKALQGIFRLLHDLELLFQELTGMDRFTLSPAAGAHGELLGMMITRAYHAGRGDARRRVVLVPDSSHGTNPASAAQHGFEVVTIKSNSRGRVDLAALGAALNDRTACLMLTNPNTLGLFEDEILEIVSRVHRAGGLLYYDGANMNPLLGVCRPGDMGFDILHLNLHKSFSTPHGGGGPGAGPVGVKSHLACYLPAPLLERRSDGTYGVEKQDARSVGRVKSFFGNIGVLIRAYCYIRMLGREGLRRAARQSVVSANYLKARLSELFELPYPEPCLHEFVLSAARQKAKGVSALDIAKRLLDYGFHAPTVYFPLIVPEALMIEPTETESKDTLDGFVAALREIAREVDTVPERVRQAPETTPVGRCDEVAAARNPVLSFARETVRKGAP